MKIFKSTQILLFGVSISIATFSVRGEQPFFTTPDAPTTVKWQSLGDNEDSDGWHYVQRITVSGKTGLKGLAFNQFARKMKLMNEVDTLTEIIPGYYLITSPRFIDGVDSVVFDLDTRGFLVNCSYAPDGFHAIMHDNTASPVRYEKVLLTDTDLHHAFHLPKYKTAADIYKFNESLTTDWTPGVYDILPSFSSITLLNNNKTVINPEIVEILDPTLAVNGHPNLVTITVQDGKAQVAGANEKAVKSARNVFNAKVLNVNTGKPLPEAVLVYNPQFEWRGFMLDIARNYQTPQTVMDLLDIMAENGLNKLHFHAVDDEAWRLEIPSLPELTAVGSRRGWGTDESDHLYQIFTGDGNPDNLKGSSNGYFTREDFIRVLQHAKQLGIDVLPEIESPGHARAAIKAMEARAKAGDSSYRLIHDNDTSKYTSAQSFHDNVMNPALESTYKFMETVIDDIIAMYKDADVELIGIHIGGDEVARGGWNGSEVAKNFMAENGLKDQHEFHAYFIKRMAKILQERNLPMFGWQEIALDHGSDYDSEIALVVGGVNCWSTLVKNGQIPVPVRSVLGGYPTILSNVEHFYFDLSYSPHPEEPGLTWGGHTNEFTAFSGYADKLCPVTEETPGKVIGINAHLFAETMRNPEQLMLYITPKIFGFAERAAHPDTTYTMQEFNSIIASKELPALENKYNKMGYGKTHMNQPGIIRVSDLVYMNAPYPGGEIRYTDDGTEPTKDSKLYTEPFTVSTDKDIRAKYFRNNAASQTTYLSR